MDLELEQTCLGALLPRAPLIIHRRRVAKPPLDTITVRRGITERSFAGSCKTVLSQTSNGPSAAARRAVRTPVSPISRRTYINHIASPALEH